MLGRNFEQIWYTFVMKADIDLYETDPKQYDSLQMLRPDYAHAKTTLLELATKYFKDKKGIVLADFCSGTGINTKMLAGRISVSKAILIDINREFIEIAKQSNINAVIEPVVSDILNVHLESSADMVISMFAYHHVPDERKADYIEKAKDVLKKGGVIMLGEIYVPNKEVTLEYYKQLYNEIPKKSAELERFLMQTANSGHFEYKVTKEFADRQLIEAGFELVESRKIWPIDNRFGFDVGTFVEVWKLLT